MPHVHARGQQLHLTGVGISAQVEFKVGGHPVDLDPALARRHQGLGHKVARQNVGPHAFGQLVTPVSGLATVARGGLEKEMFALRPQSVCLIGRHQQGLRHRRLEPRAVWHRGAPGGQLGIVTQGNQVALVGVQRMGVWVGRQDDRARRVSLAQRLVRGVFQVKVCQAVVDQVNRALA